MKTIHTTHIDTGGHGYYSVSKKDILMLGINPEQITGYSGQTLKRVYLEEDQDAQLFFNAAKEKGYVVVTKNGYNLNFAVHHNYNAKLFSWHPQSGQRVMCGNRPYTIDSFNEKSICVVDASGRRYKVTMSNPFNHIQEVIN